MSMTLELAQALIARPSITPEDAGCQELISAHLRPLGFRCETLQFGAVRNLWASWGESGPLLVFAGHTDVVPPGPEEQWISPPFVPTVRDGLLYGRGAADMKGSLAAMVSAITAFLVRHPAPQGRIGLLLTSDEEGPAVDGTVRVVEELARRGSLSGNLTVRGVQGHVAYPQKAINPIHLAAPALSDLVAERWDEGTPEFPPTTLQVSNLHAGTGAGNVIPGMLNVQFNFRFNPSSPAARLRERTEALLAQHGLDFHIDWTLGAEPFLTAPGLLVDTVRAAIEAVTGRQAKCSTIGGTSDARFIARHCSQVVELGPVNTSIHQINEWVDVAELDQLTAIYEQVLERLLG